MTPPLGSWRVNAALAAVNLGLLGTTLAGWRGVVLTPTHLVVNGTALLAFFAIGLAVRSRARLSDLLVGGGWALSLQASTSPVTYALLRTPDPLSDGWLAQVDADLGLTVPAVRAFTAHLPTTFWWIVYDSLIPILAVAVIALPLLGRADRLRRLLVAYAISFLVALPILATVHAIGPWTVYGFAPTPSQAVAVRDIALLKQPGRFVYDPMQISGVVAFPSFHTLLATLAGWALAPTRLGPPAILLAAGIVIATVATGWHYVADVLGGLAVAAVSIGAAALLDRAGAWRQRDA